MATKIEERNNRYLVTIKSDTVADEEKTYEMFNTLLGDDLAGRKRFIAENGYKYVDIADV